MITVTTTTGIQQVDGSTFDVASGILTITDDDGTGVAVFAPGIWESAMAAAVEPAATVAP